LSAWHAAHGQVAQRFEGELQQLVFRTNLTDYDNRLFAPPYRPV
jgi:hypothetical protein